LIDVTELVDGGIVDLTPPVTTIVAETDEGNTDISSVRFIVDGNIEQLESNPIYAIAGVDNTPLRNWIPGEPLGNNETHTLFLEAFSLDNGQGDLLTTETIRFISITDPEVAGFRVTDSAELVEGDVLEQDDVIFVDTFGVVITSVIFSANGVTNVTVTSDNPVSINEFNVPVGDLAGPGETVNLFVFAVSSSGEILAENSISFSIQAAPQEPTSSPPPRTFFPVPTGTEPPTTEPEESLNMMPFFIGGGVLGLSAVVGLFLYRKRRISRKKNLSDPLIDNNVPLNTF
jgi:hypothetical protein